ncbi:hypothetical protein [Nocardia asiatica]|uniref:hypothetical protein n=1 Tax=Nocardia asiatica TaxID=209252 RepID=UPI0002EB22DB|nr:hypothetical protein [Nocardia asiatica]
MAHKPTLTRRIALYVKLASLALPRLVAFVRGDIVTERAINTEIDAVHHRLGHA